MIAVLRDFRLLDIVDVNLKIVEMDGRSSQRTVIVERLVEVCLSSMKSIKIRNRKGSCRK